MQVVIRLLRLTPFNYLVDLVADSATPTNRVSNVMIVTKKVVILYPPFLAVLSEVKFHVWYSEFPQ